MGPHDPERDPPLTPRNRGRDLPEHVQKQLDELEELFGEEVERDEVPTAGKAVPRRSYGRWSPRGPGNVNGRPGPRGPGNVNGRPGPRGPGNVNGRPGPRGPGNVNGRHVMLPINGKRRPRRHRLLSRPLLLVVIIVAVLAVGGGLSILLSPLEGSGRIRIDGSAADWAGIAAHQADRGNAPGSVDIIAFSFLDQKGRVSFMVRVAGTALAGGPGEPDRGDAFHFFIDRDGSVASGYQVAGMGADIELRVEGRSGKVSSSEIRVFEGNDPQNYSAFTPTGNGAAAVSGDFVEAQLSASPGGFGRAASFTVTSTGYDGAADHFGYPVSATRPTVRIFQEAPPGLAYPRLGGVPLLNLTLSATGPAKIESLGIAITGVVTNVASDLGSVSIESGRAVVRDISISASTTLHLTGDLSSAPDSQPVGLRLAFPSDVVTEALVLADPPARDSLKYVGPAPPPTVDGAFGDWQSPQSDAAGDGGGYARLDISTFAANRSGTQLDVYMRVAGSLFAGAEVPYHSPLVVFQAPKPGNGSGVPIPLPRASGEDRMAALIDTDGNPDSGLPLGSLGVDAAVMAGGREGVIGYSGLYAYLGGRGAQAQWSRIGDAPMDFDSAQWEGSADLGGLNLQPTLKVLFVAESWDLRVGDATSSTATDRKQSSSAGLDEGVSPSNLMKDSVASMSDPVLEPMAVEGTSFADVPTLNSRTELNPDEYKAQSFTVAHDMHVTRTRAALCDEGSTQNTVTMELRTDNGAGEPSTTVIESSTLPLIPLASPNCATLAGNYYWRNADWNLHYFKSGTLVWLVVRTAALSSTEAVSWGVDTGLPYTGGSAMTSPDGTTWSPSTTNDRTFSAYGSEVFPYEDNVELQSRTDRWDVAGTANVWQNGSVTAGDGLPGNVDHTRSSGAGANLLWGTTLGADYADSVSATLTSNYIVIPAGTSPVLSFWHHYDAELDFDGGRVQIQTDSASGFSLISPIGGYPCADIAAFGSGMNPGYCGAASGWRRAVFDLAPYLGNTIKVRFHFQSDGGVVAKGWYIDDIRIGFPVELQELHTFGSGTGNSAGEYVKFYNFGPSSVNLDNWDVLSTSGAHITVGGTIAAGGTFDFYTSSGQNWYGDAGDRMTVRANNSVPFYNGTGAAMGTGWIRVDYTQYGSFSGTPPWMTGMLWTGTNPTAPANNAQYLIRVTDGSFTGVDTGDGADWVMIPETGGVWSIMAASGIAFAALSFCRSQRAAPSRGRTNGPGGSNFRDKSAIRGPRTGRA